ncbi:unnamed protein product [Moneuplotes crassus]|uniref:Uncharacterized protein n=1 Tax=Euplotes crassus TaxID=5936 RepID=A0AAD2D0T8_EUPCR|nr:unnamed protein product [Moneuplotes crassus]
MNANLNTLQEFIEEVLAVMSENGVKKHLLEGLNDDPEFSKFCTEWAAGRWIYKTEICNKDLITSLKNKLKKFANMIEKMKIPYREKVDHDFTTRQLKLDKRLLQLKNANFMVGNHYSFDMKSEHDSKYFKSSEKFKSLKCRSINLLVSEANRSKAKKIMIKSIPKEVESFKIKYTNYDSSQNNFNTTQKNLLPLKRQNSTRLLKLKSCLCYSTLLFGTTQRLKTCDTTINTCDMGGIGCCETLKSLSNLPAGLYLSKWAHSSLRSILLDNNGFSQDCLEQMLRSYNLTHPKLKY